MTYKIRLDENDIKHIIAEKFGVQVKDVTLAQYSSVEGYGMGEHIIQKIVAEVEDSKPIT